MIAREQAGFTLLEAMVAIVVLSTVSFAVFSWVNQSVSMLLRADSVMSQELLMSDLLAELEHADLQSTSEGELYRGGARLYWQSKALERRQGRTSAGLVGFHDLTLYEVAVQIFRDDISVADFKLRVVNSSLVRRPSEELRL